MNAKKAREEDGEERSREKYSGWKEIFVFVIVDGTDHSE